jgi:hypothetical protein
MGEKQDKSNESKDLAPESFQLVRLILRSGA